MNIPTAEEFMTDEYQIKHYGTILLKPNQAAIEFAKLHVQAALEAAFEDAPWGSSTDTVSYREMKNAILDAYPLDNIK